jgi:hypothetical protein
MTGVQDAARRDIARFALFLVASVLVSRIWFIVHRAIDVDEFEHAHAVWCVARGQIPYLDFFEHHTPGLYLLFAPVFRLFATDTDPAAAVSWFVFCRFVMLAMTAGSVALVYTLGVMWRDHFTGALAAALVTTSSQFLDTMLELRPDVPALLCVLCALVLGVDAWRADRRRIAAVTFFLSGVALGAALMFTQKYVFAVPGFGAALLVYAVNGQTGGDVRARASRLAWFVLGLAAPIGWAAWWFAAHHALGAFVQFNVAENIRLSASRFSPLPRVLSNVVHAPALLLLGAAGFVEAVQRIRTRRDDSLLLAGTAASLFAGLFFVGRAYQQYFIMFFPHLAVFGAGFAQHLWRTPSLPMRSRLAVGALLLLIPAASLGALLAFIPDRTSGPGAAMIGAFTLAAVLTAAAAWRWLCAQPVRAACTALVALAALSLGNLARRFEPMAPQIVDITYVIQHTRPTDTVLGASTGPGVFRPHAWYYFFNSGPFASDRELADLADAIETARISPQIVVLEDYREQPMPPAVRRYVRQHYRQVRGTMYERLPD